MNIKQRVDQSLVWWECTSDLCLPSHLYIFLYGFENSLKTVHFDFVEQLTNQGYLVVLPELSYHGERIQEPFLTGDFASRVRTMFSIIENTPSEIYHIRKHYIDRYPTFAIGGVSMGAMIAYYLAHQDQDIRLVHAMIGTPHISTLLEQSNHQWILSSLANHERKIFQDQLARLIVPTSHPNYQMITWFIQLGELDTMVSLDSNLQFIKNLQEQECPVLYKIYPCGHEITIEMKNDALQLLKARNSK